MGTDQLAKHCIFSILCFHNSNDEDISILECEAVLEGLGVPNSNKY